MGALRLERTSFRPTENFIEEATDLVQPFNEPEKDRPVYGVNNKEGVFLNSSKKGETFNAPTSASTKTDFEHYIQEDSMPVSIGSTNLGTERSLSLRCPEFVEGPEGRRALDQRA